MRTNMKLNHFITNIQAQEPLGQQYAEAVKARAEVNPMTALFGELFGAIFLVWLIKKIILFIKSSDIKQSNNKFSIKAYLLIYMGILLTLWLVNQNDFERYSLVYGLVIFFHILCSLYLASKAKLTSAMKSGTPESRLNQLEELRSKGLLTPDEYYEKRKEIITKI